MYEIWETLVVKNRRGFLKRCKTWSFLNRQEPRLPEPNTCSSQIWLEELEALEKLKKQAKVQGALYFSVSDS